MYGTKAKKKSQGESDKYQEGNKVTEERKVEEVQQEQSPY